MARMRKFINSMRIAIFVAAAAMFMGNSANGAVVTIGEVQGLMDGQQSHNQASPMVGKQVEVQGIIHQSLKWDDGNGQMLHGFFIQNLPDESDKHPMTSDGLFIFSGKYASLYDGRNQIPVRPGMHIRVRGTVQEFHGCTQLARPLVTAVLGFRPEWQRQLEIREAAPPDNESAASAYWESMEGMRCQLSAGAVVTGGSKTVGGGSESYVWVISKNHPVAKRPNPKHARTFRDAHPLDDIGTQLFDNGNGYRITLSSTGLLSDPVHGQLIQPAGTGERSLNDLAGAVHFSYGNYKICISEPARWNRERLYWNQPSPDASLNARGIATYNVENLYDHRNDPNDPCDDLNDPGNDNVRPPFNYLPATETQYYDRLEKLAGQIAVTMMAPEIILVQEIEDQDINFVTPANHPGGAAAFQKDGKPDVLQELAQVLKNKFDLRYVPASNRAGADDRGISCGFMIRTDKWKWASAIKTDWDGSGVQGIQNIAGMSDGNGNASVTAWNGWFQDRSSGERQKVFSRALQVALIEPADPQAAGNLKFLALVNNHFSSIPDQRIDRRRKQAQLAAAVAGAYARIDGCGVILGGDLNVFPRPDDGTPASPSDQLKSIYDLKWQSADSLLLKDNPESAFTYVYQGQAQTLDHLFFSNNLDKFVTGASVFHMNADSPDHPDETRVSDHDPVIIYLNY